MAYSTQYRMKIYEADGTTEISGDRTLVWRSDVASGYGTLDECCGEDSDAHKWYDHDADMIAMSRDYPDLVFALDGMGEETGDIWRGYFHDGRCQVWRPDLTPAPFDRSKLKDPPVSTHRRS